MEMLNDEQLEKIVGGANGDYYSIPADGKCPCCDTKLLKNHYLGTFLITQYYDLCYCTKCKKGFLDLSASLLETDRVKIKDGELIIDFSY